MVLSHFEAALLNLIFGGFEWVISRYLILQAANFYMTEFPHWAGIPHVDFMLAVAHWGLWIMVLLPTAIYLWTQTQRPEVEP